MTWGIFTTAMTVAGFGSMLLFGPSWARKWLLTCFAALGATVLIGLAIMALTVEDVDVGAPRNRASAPGVVEWIAVYHVDAPPEPERMAFIEAAGTAVVEASVTCWHELAGLLEVAPDRTVLGVWGVSEDKLRAAMDRVDGEPIAIAELRNVCPGD